MTSVTLFYDIHEKDLQILLYKYSSLNHHKLHEEYRRVRIVTEDTGGIVSDVEILQHFFWLGGKASRSLWRRQY